MEKQKYSDGDKILSQCKARYEEALSQQLYTLFGNPNRETWAEVRKLLSDETGRAVSKLLADISGLDLDSEKSNKMVQDLTYFGRTVVERIAREEAGKVLQRMKIRFKYVLSNALIKRKNHNKETTKDACIESLKILSVMVAIRLDEKPVIIDNKVFSFCKGKIDQHYKKASSSSGTEKHNTVEKKILSLSKDTMGKIENMLISSGKEKRDRVIENILISSFIHEKSRSKNFLASSSTWPEVSAKDIIITPAECKLLWEKFLAEMLSPTQAFTTGQDANTTGLMSFAAGLSGAAATIGTAD